MGYTTRFEGHFELDFKLEKAHHKYLEAFAATRRMKRDVELLEGVQDPLREDVRLPLGEDGAYFLGSTCPKPSRDEAPQSIVDESEPPVEQPSLWCGWVPTADGWGLAWDGREKFYRYIDWLEYVIDHFLEPWGYRVYGDVRWQGEDESDRGVIRVENNRVAVCLDDEENPGRIRPDVAQKVTWTRLRRRIGRETLYAVYRSRFGAMPKPLRAALEKMRSVERLYAWLEPFSVELEHEIYHRVLIESDTFDEQVHIALLEHWIEMRLELSRKERRGVSGG